jgi:hypothetical protein
VSPDAIKISYLSVIGLDRAAPTGEITVENRNKYLEKWRRVRAYELRRRNAINRDGNVHEIN